MFNFEIMPGSTLPCFTTLFSCACPTTALGEDSIGFGKTEVTSAQTRESFSLALVYPTDIPAETVGFGPFEMDLSVNAAIAEGKFPVSIISHGSGGSNLEYRSIAFALARQGRNIETSNALGRGKAAPPTA